MNDIFNIKVVTRNDLFPDLCLYNFFFFLGPESLPKILRAIFWISCIMYVIANCTMNI